MAAEVIVGSAVGAIVLYLWGWQRVKYVRWYLQRHKRAEEFERSMREAREGLTGACPYRKPTDADRALLAQLPDDRDLVAAGFSHAGELVLATPREARAVRCYYPVARSKAAIRRLISHFIMPLGRGSPGPCDISSIR